jgi:hypothetical protein
VALADPATGEVVREFSSAAEPDGVLLRSCGNRRACVCPSCSDVYRGDAWQLAVCGLRGGKGVPDTVASHPIVFATFTAPSFGAVHTVREAHVELCSAWFGQPDLPCRSAEPARFRQGRPARAERSEPRSGVLDGFARRR